LISTWSMFERVLIAYDGSPAARAALDLAGELAASLGSQVTIAHVLEPVRGGSAGDVEQPPADEEAAARWLAEVGDWGSAAGGPKPTPAVLGHGQPAAQVLDLAERDRFDLIIAGKTGRHGLGGFLFGSVAEKIVRRAPCSVAVVPAESAAGTPPRVLAGHDGSETSLEAIRVASVVATALSAGLLVAHVVDYRVPFVGVPSATARELMRERGEEVLMEGCAGVSAPLESVERELFEGDPRAGLLEAVRKFSPRLLAIGKRGSGGFPGLLLGSTAEAVVREADCPVLVVKPAAADEGAVNG
jgi:nucleotide-binding universal stress UspA family protein